MYGVQRGRTKGGRQPRLALQHWRSHLQARWRKELALRPASVWLYAKLGHKRVSVQILAPEPAVHQPFQGHFINMGGHQQR